MFKDPTYEASIRNRNAIMRIIQENEFTTEQDFRNSIEKLSRSYSSTYLKKIVSLALKDKKFERSFVKSLNRQIKESCPRKNSNVLSRKDQQILIKEAFETLKTSQNKNELIISAIIILMSISGKRFSDIQDLSLDDVLNLQKNKIINIFIKKVEKNGILSLSRENEHIIQTIIDHLLPFCDENEKFSSNFTVNDKYKLFNNLYTRAFGTSKPNGLGFHSFRFAYAQNNVVNACAEAVINSSKTIQGELDHSRLDMTKHYILSGIEDLFKSETNK